MLDRYRVRAAMNVLVYRPSAAAGGLDRNGDPIEAPAT